MVGGGGTSHATARGQATAEDTARHRRRPKVEVDDCSSGCTTAEKVRTYTTQLLDEDIPHSHAPLL